ncbi:hypothetical protein HDU93_003435, partial [Gonapodya sp. JEL0774]
MDPYSHVDPYRRNYVDSETTLSSPSTLTFPPHDPSRRWSAPAVPPQTSVPEVHLVQRTKLSADDHDGPSRKPARLSLGDLELDNLKSVTRQVGNKIKGVVDKFDDIFDEFAEGAVGVGHSATAANGGVAVWPEGKGRAKFPNGHYFYRPLHLCTLRRPFCEVVGDADHEEDITSTVYQWIGCATFLIGLSTLVYTHIINFLTFLQIMNGTSNWYTDGWNSLTAMFADADLTARLLSTWRYAGAVVFGADSVMFFIVSVIFLYSIVAVFWLFYVEYKFVSVLENKDKDNVMLTTFLAEHGPAKQAANLSPREKQKRAYRYIRKRRQLAVFRVLEATGWLRFGSSLSLLAFLNFDYSTRTAEYLMTIWMEWLTDKRQLVLERNDPGQDPGTPGAATP